ASIYKDVARLLLAERADLERRRAELAGVCDALLPQRRLGSTAELADKVDEARRPGPAGEEEAARAGGAARPARAGPPPAPRGAPRLADWMAQRARLRAELLRLDRDAPAMDGARGAIARAERAAPLVAARALADAAAAERGRRGVEAGERAAARAACADELE